MHQHHTCISEFMYMIQSIRLCFTFNANYTTYYCERKTLGIRCQCYYTTTTQFWNWRDDIPTSRDSGRSISSAISRRFGPSIIFNQNTQCYQQSETLWISIRLSHDDLALYKSYWIILIFHSYVFKVGCFVRFYGCLIANTVYPNIRYGRK